MSGHKPFSALRAKMSPERQAKNAAETAKLAAEMPLHELRAALELSQKQLAETLGVDQPAVSKMERRTDMYVSTLRNFIEAMGGHLEVRAVFVSGAVDIAGFGSLHDTKVSNKNTGRKKLRA